MAFPARWTRRCALVVNHLKVAGDFSNTTIKLTAANLPAAIFTDAKSDGSDIRVTSDAAGTTQLPVDIVVFTPGSSIAEIYFNCTNISSTVDVTYYIWYGNPCATAVAVTDTYGRNAVWTAVSAVSVHHLQEASGTLINSTGDATYDGTGSNITYGENVGDGTKCVKFVAASNSKITLGGNNIPESPHKSFEGWIYLNTYGGSSRGRIISEENLSVGHGFAVNDVSDNDTVYFKGNTDLLANVNKINTGAWYHVAFTYQTGTGSKAVKIYINGVEEASGSIDIEAGGSNTVYGARANDVDRNFDGWMDELRVYDAVESPEAVLTSYRSQSDPASFVTPGTPTALAGLPSICVGEVWKTQCGSQICIGGVWKDITEVQMIQGGAWKTVG